MADKAELVFRIVVMIDLAIIAFTLLFTQK